MVIFSFLSDVLTTEAKGRGKLAPIGFLPSLAGGAKRGEACLLELIIEKKKQIFQIQPKRKTYLT
jgi:hypothetical protein